MYDGKAATLTCESGRIYDGEVGGTKATKLRWMRVRREPSFRERKDVKAVVRNEFVDGCRFVKIGSDRGGRSDV